MNNFKASVIQKFNNAIGRNKALNIADDISYEVINFCTTHKEPELPLTDETIRLEIGDTGTLDRAKNKHVVNCFQEVPELKQYRHEIVIISGLITACRFLQKHRIDKRSLVNFTTYRLFVLPTRIKPHSPWTQMNHVMPNQVGLYKDKITFPTTKNPYLLPMFFANAPLQKFHENLHGSKIFDFFLQSAIKENVINEYHAFKVKNHALHLTAMGIGRLPVGVFIDIAEKLEPVLFRFLKDHLHEIPKEHRFKCALYYYERLAIYLMEFHILNRYDMLPSTAFGFWTLVNEKAEYIPGKLEVK